MAEDILELLFKGHPERVLERDQKANFDRQTNSQEADRIRQLGELFERFLVLTSEHIQPQNPEEDVTFEGNFGVLPSPAKRIVARELMEGKAPSPLRIYEEKVLVDAPERQIDTMTLHLITEVEPATIADLGEQRDTLTTIKGARDFVSRGEIYLPASSTYPPIRVSNPQAVIHLIKRGVFGDYDYQRLPINAQTATPDTQKAITAYQQGINDVIFKPLKDPPTSDIIAHTILDAQIVREIQNELNVYNIAAPILIYPKYYRTFIHGNHRETSMLDSFKGIYPMIRVDSGGEPQIQRFNAANGYFTRV